MTESRQSKTPGGSAPSSSQIAGSHFLPTNVLFVFEFASVIFGCASSIFHVAPSTKNLYMMALPNGTVRSTVQTLPFFVIGLPVIHVSAPPKLPRSSTDVSPLNGYVMV